MPSFPALLLTALAASPLPFAPTDHAARWGALGHRIVVTLAWDHLSPRTREAVARLLGDMSLADASTWADRIRNERRESGPWHYVNIPVQSSAWDSAAWCRGGDCVVGAIGRYRKVLADAAAPTAERAEALRFLLHFVGDMHQPLHVGDRGDRGGNDLRVTWRGRDTNLHSVWDTDLLTAWSLSEGRYTQALRRRIQRMRPEERQQLASGSVEGWAMDGAAISRNVVYRLPGDGVIPDDYLRSAGPVLDLVLIQAGLRLARVLNEALDGT